jgi:hypothetical protein
MLNSVPVRLRTLPSAEIERRTREVMLLGVPLD